MSAKRLAPLAIAAATILVRARLYATRPTLDRIERISEGGPLPPHRVRHWIAEHFQEEGGEDAVSLGVGLGAEAAQMIGPVEDLDDAALFGEGGQRNPQRRVLGSVDVWLRCHSALALNPFRISL